MELPHLGRNCALKQCNRLDFLPVKCDSCSQIFCIEHYKYDTHQCLKARDKNVQVPVCPLCSEPVAARRDQLPDVAVSQHIDQSCRSNELLKNHRQKQKTNLQSCNYKLCKRKDVIYLECSDCRSKFCVKHRHPSDHSCSGPPSMGANLANNWQSFKGSCSSSAASGYEKIMSKAHQISRSGQAAINRMNQARQRASHQHQAGTSGENSRARANQAVNSLQGNLTESEALAIALNESKGGNEQPPSEGAFPISGHEDEDLALAKALHESQLEAARNQRAQGKDQCVLS